MWIKYRTSAILGVSFLMLMASFWLLPQLAFVVFISLLLDLLLHPFVDRLHRVRLMPRGLAAAVTLLGFALFVTLLVTMLSHPLAVSIQKFSYDLPALNDSIRALFSEYPVLADQVDELWGELASVGLSAISSSLGALISVFAKVFDIVVIMFSAFYLLKDGRAIEEWLARLFPHTDHLRVLKLFDRVLRALYKYISSQLAICFIMGILVFIYFALSGLPYAAVFAVLSGVSEFVPVIGPTVASLFGVALAATISPWTGIKTLIFYLVITQANHNLIYPTLIGKTLNLHPIAILLGILLGGSLLAAPGMFLAVPMIVTIRIVINDILDAAKKYERRPSAESRR